MSQVRSNYQKSKKTSLGRRGFMNERSRERGRRIGRGCRACFGVTLKRGVERVKKGEPALIDIVTQPRG